ncbi:MAG: RNA polymerase subunit sigma-24, partial [Acidobacteriota bacterium]|nr:RNA polymerase subunit sigma-24 [Acidobacteriota bacterium]
MSPLETLAPDQRAVLQLVLQRGRSYDQIAAMLSIGREAVRQRAHDALDALTPASGRAGPGRALVADYLLGQLTG